MAADFTIHIVDQAVTIVLAEQLEAAFFNVFYLQVWETGIYYKIIITR